MNDGSVNQGMNPSVVDASGIHARVQAYEALQPKVASKKVTHKENAMTTINKNIKSNNFDKMMAAQQAVVEVLRNDHLAKVEAHKASRPEPKKVLFNGNVSGIVVTVHEHSVFINDDDKRGVNVFVQGEVSSAAYLAAISALHTDKAKGNLKIHEVGLHSLKNPEDFGPTENRAWIVTAAFKVPSWMEKHENAKNAFLAVKPEKGINVVAFKEGNLKVFKNIPGVPAIDKNLSFDNNRANIYEYKFYVALDEILAGNKIEVSPRLRDHVLEEDGSWARYANDAWVWKKNPERVEKMISTYAKAFSASPEEAVVIVAGNKEASVSKKVNYALYKRAATLEVAGLDLWSHPIKVDGEVVTFKDMAGRTLQMKRNGNVCGLVEVVEQKLAYLVMLVQPEMQRSFSTVLAV